MSVCPLKLYVGYRKGLSKIVPESDNILQFLQFCSITNNYKQKQIRHHTKCNWQLEIFVKFSRTIYIISGVIDVLKFMMFSRIMIIFVNV